MSPERPPRSLRGHAWFLTGVNGVFDVRNALCMSPGSAVLILKSLVPLEVSECFPIQLKTVLLLANIWVILASYWSYFDGVKDERIFLDA